VERDPDEANDGRGESERHRQRCDFDQYVAATHLAGGGAHVTVEKFAEARFAQVPARVVHGVGRREQKQAKKEEEEIAVIEKFLPKQLSAEEVKAELVKIIAQVGASSPADMGKVMGVATKHLAGKADGKTVSTLVKELLAKS